jgi:hypothetical protein
MTTHSLPTAVAELIAKWRTREWEDSHMAELGIGVLFFPNHACADELERLIMDQKKENADTEAGTYPLPPTVVESVEEIIKQFCVIQNECLSLSTCNPVTLMERLVEHLTPVWESAVREQVETMEEAAYKEGWDHGWVGAGLPNGAPGSEPLSVKGALARHDQELRDAVLEEVASKLIKEKEMFEVEHGQVDPESGCWEATAVQEQHTVTLEEATESIRALTTARKHLKESKNA